MSDILAGIDDTLDNWHGSRDSMTSYADETNPPSAAGVRFFAKYTGTDTPPTVQDPMARYLDSLTRSLDLLSLVSRTEDEPTPAP